MPLSAARLKRIVLEAVSEDYESFESVVSKLLRLPDADEGRDIDRIEHSLLSLVAHRLVGAYLIHADPPYATAISVHPDTVRQCWFFITDEGREYLRRPAEEPPISGVKLSSRCVPPVDAKSVRTRRR
jgi:hypothetical protein